MGNSAEDGENSMETDDQGPRVGSGEGTILTLSDVEKHYGAVTALDGVSLEFEQGEFHLLVGPNGSGKTTLFRVVLGLTRPSAGTVTINPGTSLGVAFQRPSHYPALTVAENLDVFGSLGNAHDVWLEEVVERLRLEPVRDRPARALSGGYARKLDLALAFAKEPDIALLDEPLGDLDDATRERLLTFLAEYRAAGGTVVVSTHNLRRFTDSLDRLTVLSHGRVIVDEPRQSLPMDIREFYVDRVLAGEDA